MTEAGEPGSKPSLQLPKIHKTRSKRACDLLRLQLMQRVTSLFLMMIGLLTALSVSAGVAQMTTVWPQQAVSVCWSRVELMPLACTSPIEKLAEHAGDITIPSEEIRAKVRGWIEHEFALARTGIHFTGWAECGNDPKADVLIFFSESANPVEIGGYSTLGKCGHSPGAPVREGRPGIRLHLPVTKNAIDSWKYALHEFGHLAGLVHEDYFNVPNENLNRHNLSAFTSYDAKSIMSYKALDNKSNRPELSTGDIHTLRCLYSDEKACEREEF